MFFKKTNAKMQNVKLIAVATLVAIIAGTFMYFVGAGTPHRTVAATGECIASVERDRTAVSIRITVLDNNAAMSLRRAQDIHTHLSDYLMGVGDGALRDNITTTRFDSHERRRWDNDSQTEVGVGFETNIELLVSSENRRLIERVLSDISFLENVFPGNLQMTSSPAVIQAAMDACIETAVARARANADAIAAAEGRRTGRMISAEFNKGQTAMQPRPMMMQRAMVMADGMMGGGLHAADGEMSVSVNAIFNLR